MRKKQITKKTELSPVIQVLEAIGQIFIVLGSPTLFALRILFWAAIWVGRKTFSLMQLSWETLKEVPDLLWELEEDIYSGASKQYKKLNKQWDKKSQQFSDQAYLIGKTSVKAVQDIEFPSLPKTPKFKAPKFKMKFNLPNFSLPKIALPNITIPTVPKFSLITRPEVKPTRGRPKIKPVATFPIKLRYLTIGATLALFLAFIPYWFVNTLEELPSPYALKAREIPIATKIYDRNGTLLYQFYAEENRTLVTLDTLPKHVINATLAIEDKNFYRHIGFDPQGIGRAVLANSNGEIVQGGSTITQQLIKSALLTPTQTVERKVKEVILSIWAERIYTKDQILEMYLNQVAYGGTAYGIQAAAQTYFNKKPADLTLAESALLAGLPNSPSNYSPFGPHPELSKARQRQVLTAMASQGYITTDEAQQAANEELHFVSPETSIKAPHFVMYVKDYLIKKYGNRLVEQGGLEVTTSLDFPLYEAASKIVKEGVDKQSYLRVGNGAALVTNPQTGEILAMIGSRDFFDIAKDGNVNVTLAPRSPGSSIKPLTYALGMEKRLITPSTVITDVLTTFRIPGAAPYIPKNYDNKTSGRVTIRTALARSLNIPAVKVMERVGVKDFIDFAKKLGLTTLDDPNRFGLALTLGGGEVLMTDMATAYSSFATNGERVDLKPVLLVKDYKGRVLEDNTTSVHKERVMSTNTAFLINDILSDDNARSGTFGRGSILNIPGHTVAVKTGTTENKRDNWAIGYTPSYLVAVWVGNNDNSLMSPALESGNTGAAAIWNPIFTQILSGKPNQGFARPSDVIAVQVCALNGLLPCANCPAVRTEYFTKGTEPTQSCNLSKEEVEKQAEEEKKLQGGGSNQNNGNGNNNGNNGQSRN